MDTPARRILTFLFSLKGRIARLPFLATIVVTYGAIIALAQMLAKSAGVLHLTLSALVLAVFAAKFIFTTKRLHDIGLPALLASPIIVVTCLGLYNNFVVPALHVPRFVLRGNTMIGHLQVSYFVVEMVVLLGAILLSDTALLFIPGNRGNNRYGNDLRRLEHTFTDVF